MQHHPSSPSTAHNDGSRSPRRVFGLSALVALIAVVATGILPGLVGGAAAQGQTVGETPTIPVDDAELADLVEFDGVGLPEADDGEPATASRSAVSNPPIASRTAPGATTPDVPGIDAAPETPAAPGLSPGSTIGAQPDDVALSPADTNEQLIAQSERLNQRFYAISTRELVITEVMQNPQVSYDSDGEWFELHNPYNRAIKLNGWIIADLGTEEHLIESDEALIIEPGDYFVLGTNPDTATNGGVKLDYSYGPAIRLFNSSDALVVQRPSGAVAARVAWDDGATFPDPNGESMSLRNVFDDDEVGTNWCASTRIFGDGDLGTPGEANDCTVAPAVVVTEIMQNPDAVSDTTGEWFEVMNLGADTVNLQGWTIRDDDTDRHVITGPVIVAPGDRAVLARNGDTDLNGGVDADYVYGDDVKLFNSYDELSLIDPDDHRSYRVKWNDGVSFPDPTGASMNMIELRGESEDASNWCTSAKPFGLGDLGTPGTAGSCSDASGEESLPVLITEIMRNSDAISDSVGEWFEIYNPNDVAVDLDGWVIRDQDTNHHVITGSVVVEPNGYLVLGRSDGHTPEHAYVYDDIILHNGSDEIILVDASDSIIDTVAWDDHFPSIAGASMSLIDVDRNNDVAESWCASVTEFETGDRGTPGATNRCDNLASETALVITEVMANPSASYDSHGEWFEVHNPGREAVDLKGFTIKDEDFNDFVIGDSLIAEPGAYLVFARLGEVALNGGITVDYVYDNQMSLINSGDELVILDTERQLVDHLAWGSGTGWTIPDGSSLQLIDPATDNADHSAWCEAHATIPSGDTGTPGHATNCDPVNQPVAPETEDSRCKEDAPGVILGTEGADLLFGTSGNDVIIGLGGNDIIDGGGGDDIICAGDGSDVVNGGFGDDVILGGDGNDGLSGGPGNDVILSGDGNDVVLGGSGDDSINLGDGDDWASLGSGNDKADGNLGTDKIYGGSGEDTCLQAEAEHSCEA